MTRIKKEYYNPEKEIFQHRREFDIFQGIWRASLERMRELSDRYFIYSLNRWILIDEHLYIYAQADDGKIEFAIHAQRLDFPWEEDDNFYFFDKSWGKHAKYPDLVAAFKKLHIHDNTQEYYSQLFDSIKAHKDNCGKNDSFTTEIKKIYKLGLIGKFVAGGGASEELYENLNFQVDIILLNAKTTQERKLWSIKNWIKKLKNREI